MFIPHNSKPGEAVTLLFVCLPARPHFALLYSLAVSNTRRKRKKSTVNFVLELYLEVGNCYVTLSRPGDLAESL